MWYKTVRRYRLWKLRTVLFRWCDENTSLVALDVMAKTWNFVTKKIADGVNKFISFFCLILIWCVSFSTWFDFIAGNTSCRKINQSTMSIHSVPSVLVFRTAQVETPGWSVRQTHTQKSLHDTYLKHGIGWHTTQYGKGYCQRYDDFQGNEGHFMGDWLNIVYRCNQSSAPLKKYR